MADALQPSGCFDQSVVLHNVSWETYERLLSERRKSGNPRLNYDQGSLEIMILSLQHERLQHTLATLVELLAHERGLDVEGMGAAAFRRADMARGFEPDACFYFSQAARMRARDEIDLTVDPAPDLVIEVDLTPFSLNKLLIFAALGVNEIWWYDGRQLTVCILDGEEYQEYPESRVLAGLSAARLTELLLDSRLLTRRVWVEQVRQAAAEPGANR